MNDRLTHPCTIRGPEIIHTESSTEMNPEGNNKNGLRYYVNV